jgi:hypothetical protein
MLPSASRPWIKAQIHQQTPQKRHNLCLKMDGIVVRLVVSHDSNYFHVSYYINFTGKANDNIQS